tara:strand:+ start:37 stop:567 length:531 start_codon:yes stop_codon:yes gene_type:complete
MNRVFSIFILLIFTYSCSDNKEPAIEIKAELIVEREYDVEFIRNEISIISDLFNYDDLDLSDNEILKLNELEIESINITFEDFTGDSGGLFFNLELGDYNDRPFKAEFKVDDIINFISNKEKISLSNFFNLNDLSELFLENEFLSVVGIIKSENIEPLPAKMIVKIQIVLNAEISD